ncbi:MAG: cell well associated RhsD protein [Chitinophagaceae bacterium]|nr:cell well associated RhsD protein [Chitinophagaceae bacterium]
MVKQIFISKLCLMTLLFLPVALQAQQTPPSAYSIPMKVNYVRTWDAIKPDTNKNNFTINADLLSAKMTTQYIDGLGRPIQTVVKQGSMVTGSAAIDMVSATVYDEFGREQYKYLPFAANATGGNNHTNDGFLKLNPFQQQAAFMSQQYGGQGETYYYNKTEFEASPLNRVSKTMAPGNNSVGASRGTEIQYLVNTAADSVRIWTVTSTVSTAPATSAFYAAGELYKNITIDENSKQVAEYKDKEGKVILKTMQLAPTPSTGYAGWLCTYYVYDDFGNLRFVLPPKAVELVAGSWTISNTIRDELCFYYGYDGQNRMIIKKVPGAGEVWMVYDARDRLVMTQDANLRTAGKWMVTVYNDVNRPQTTGLLSSSSDRSTHASAAASSTTYPSTSSNFELLTQTGYDDYTTIPSGCPSGSIDNTYITSTNFFTTYNSSPDYAQAVTQSQATRGLTTWSKIKILGTTSDYLYSVNIYDEKGRPIQIKSTNASGGTDVATTQYDFSGKVLRTHIANQKSGTGANIFQVLSKMSYDSLGRVLTVTKRVNNNSTSNTTDKTIVQNRYDESGQLKKKILGTPIDSLTYDYNIRGWMLGANRDYAKSTSSTTNYFGFDLGYDKTISTYAAAQYNGNIAGTVWKTKGDNEIRKYDFTYDAVNRLTGADFNQYTSGSFSKSAGVDFSVSNLTFDANGNIATMNQKGLKLNASSYIDQLSYSYQSNTNKLQAVTDASNDNSSKLGDFKYDGTAKTSTDYAYDDNGNLISDLNKKISSITYNHLNLPQTITVTGKGTIAYTYDASGNKMKKVTTEGSIVTTTLYLMGTYVNDTLQFLPHEEGRIRFSPDSNLFRYDYFLKDHLGNVRMVLTDQVQQNAYPAASMETAQSTIENALYNNIDATRNDFPSGYPTNDTYTSPNAKVAKTNGSGNKVGPAIILKVMAGDKFNLRVSDWYKTNGTTPGTPASPLTELLNSLTGNVATLSNKTTSTELISNGVLSSGATSFLSNQNSTYTTSKPKAFINWILFDEQFNYVSSNSGFEQVGNDNGSSVTVHTKTNMPIDKNGYLYIYVSNETPNIDVYFDNLQVTHIRGPILEETHYYPFGLVMAGISSRAANITPNKDKTFQGQKFDDDLGLNYYGFKYRNHDPQIGRFIEIDPLSEKYVYNSTYAFSENHVTTHVELEGREKFPINPENGTGSTQLQKELEQKGKQEVVPQPQPIATNKEKNKEAEKPSEGGIGVGAELSVGVGSGEKGAQLSVGFFGKPGGMGQIFFTISQPQPNSTQFNADLSASSQFLVGYSPNGKFDLTGKGVNAGLGGGPVSASYSTNDPVNPAYHIFGLGPSVGVKVSGSYQNSKTFTQTFKMPFMIGLLNKL